LGHLLKVLVVDLAAGTPQAEIPVLVRATVKVTANLHLFHRFDRKLEFRAVQKTGRINDVSISASSSKSL
jgi:hypothetical protein